MTQIKDIKRMLAKLSELVGELECCPPPLIEGKSVILDAGHGGNDPGAIGEKGTKEKDVTLLVAMMIGQRLRDAGVKTIITRASDKTVSLLERTLIANRHDNASCFVSIHTDSFEDKEVSGISTFHFPKSQEGKKLASDVQKNLLQSFPKNKDRKVREANFYVLKNTRMPAALVELEFISNPEQELKFCNADVLAKYVEGVSRGILEYLARQ